MPLDEDPPSERPEMKNQEPKERKGNILIDFAVAAFMLFGMVLYGIYSLVMAIINKF
jgi:ABC-type Na+ efflux pump permease subunit